MSAHQIQRFMCDVNFDGTEVSAVSLQSKISQLHNQEIFPALEKIMDRIASQSEHHFGIDEMDIDLGIISLARLEHDLVEVVSVAFERSLIDMLGANRLPKRLEGIRLNDDSHFTMEAFVHYMRSGLLSWSFVIPEGTTLERMVTDAFAKSPEVFHESLAPVFAEAASRKRLILQFSSTMLKHILTLFSSEAVPFVVEVLSVTNASNFPAPVVKEFQLHVWDTVLQIISEGKSVDTKTLVKRLHSLDAIPAAIKSKLCEISKDSSIGDQPELRTKFSVRAKVQETGMELSSKNVATKGFYINNAGLIIVHPFLSRLFEHLKISTGNELLGPNRALFFLHFIASGQSLAPEYEMALPKLLCNIPLETPVPSNVNLTMKEKTEAEAMLRAVVGHWEALRDTSIDGLRGAFLLRPGKISLKQNGDWLLQVESRAYDILMNSLPWGISMVKLPWMKSTIIVEWNTSS
jgi:hypothetical protein